eukprot:NODE_418_length_8967_cov_0.347429.p3 type:complete len:312 gc:universal NODE_418_length_8967_cov_0.347429:2734-3669(+)
MSANHNIALYSPRYFGMCALGGIPSCGLTHWVVTPLDLVKCRAQVSVEAKTSLISRLKSVVAADGAMGLFRGGLPTFLGYSAQGACLFGFYEYFKHYFSVSAGEENSDKYRTWIYLAASATAEIIGSTALCPWEALKVRVQTNQLFTTSIVAGFKKIIKEEGFYGITKGLPPLWGRQILYTMSKFATFEKAVEESYNFLGKPKSDYSKSQQLAVSFICGYFAGVFCAIVSHPADTLVSKMNSVKKNPGESSLRLTARICKDLGFSKIWVGLGTRMLMLGPLTALQWFTYDTFKVLTGLPSSGGSRLIKPAV